MPITRSFCINYPFDDKVYDNVYQYQFLFGDALLVVPVTTQEAVKKVYLPKGDWYDLFTEERHTGAKEFQKAMPIYQIPVYVKTSAIIPVQTAVQSTKDKASDTLFVHVYNGTDKNSFVYYEDAGDGFDYQNNGFCKRTITFNPDEKQIAFSKQEGNFTSAFKKMALVLHGFGDDIKNATVNGARLEAKNTHMKLLDALENLEDYYDKTFFKSLRDA